ncbi:hypothetical protein TVAG_254960 [Trichomonas vaginalis G3]|uniref:Bap-like n=1 Tax=Trichomonas vaginalis (strain ATCC PRA-98 / G3) TaxID=412133 RepID=A2EXN8_TRIV3|nr:hypothetical protein TVAGG3_0738420 [Trichomonas vaginalis G3]EAY02595.1 hypothetical protein TVAG_254960 [Trichomonas vaginalis G3]KAI5511733.1 hypothetical protein TVAGG3_0738420 [Trichomonas vaginalis G3]|eukprot:XP_001314818.1 hypothetical protein [Trichomonas vaginalis G3]
MTIKFKVKDKDGASSVTIKYSINNNEYQTLKRVNDVTSSDKEFSATLNVPNDLREGDNNISLIANDGYLDSEPNSSTFKFEFNSPTIDIDETPDNQEFKKTYNETFHIKEKYQDEDGSGNVTIYYQFDGREANKTGNELVISSTESQTLSIDVLFPSDFEERNNHTIKIWAIDETNKQSNQITRNFSYKYNDPVFILYNFTNNKFIRGSQLKIGFKYEHQDNTHLKSLNISFDGKYNISLDKIISDSSINTMVTTIQIPKEIKTGDHKLYISGCDVHYHCSKSNKVELIILKPLSTKEVDFEFVRNFKIRPKQYY